MVWIDDQNSNISFSQSLVQRKVIILFNSMKADQGKKVAEEKFEARCSLMGFKEETFSIISNFKVKQQVLIRSCIMSSIE